MKLELPLKIKRIHLHVVADVPGKEDAELDILVNDPDADGDPNYQVKWDLPGTMLDSGPEGLKGEVPVMGFVKPVVNAAIDFAAGFAPAAVQPFIRGMKLSDG